MSGWQMASNGTIAAASGEVITLYGTTGSPITFSEFDISPGQAKAEWEFRADGTVWQDKANSASSQYAAGVSWNSGQPSPDRDYWIRFTANAGDAPDVISHTIGTWAQLNTTRWVGWEVIGLGFQISSGSVKVDIATDSGGSNIVATGYYGGTADMEI